RPFARRMPEPTGRTFATAIVWFVGAYAASAAFQRWPLALAAVFAATWLARVARSPQGGSVAAYSLALAVAGTAAEAAISSTGAFYYDHPDRVAVAVWPSRA